MPQAQPPESGGAEIGERSIAHLIHSYSPPVAHDCEFDLDQYEVTLIAAGWRPTRVDDASLLPHLDSELKHGRILRVYKDAGRMGNYFSDRSSFQFRDERGQRPLDVILPAAPVLYVFETGFVFVTLEVRPLQPSLEAFQDLCGGFARRGITRLKPDAMPAKASEWVKARADRGIEGITLRDWLAALVPGLSSEVPPGGRRNPGVFGVLYTAGPPTPAERHRLRLLHSAKQPVEPSAEDAEIAGHPAIWQPSAAELCLFSPLGAIWVVHPAEPSGLLANLDTTVRDRYVYKWLLVAHQRLELLGLSTSCAAQSLPPKAQDFTVLRRGLLRYTARYNLGHVSDEERHDQFYRRARQAVDIDGLAAEVRAEIVEVDEFLASERSNILNLVLGLLTLVLTPVGIVVGIFQREVLPPGQFHPYLLGTGRFWCTLLGHWPFWFVVMTAVAGALVFFQLIVKAGVVRFTQFRTAADKKRDGKRAARVPGTR